MAIVVETGAGLGNANSYVSEADAVAYAADRGITLTEGAALQANIIKAADYLNTWENSFPTVRNVRTQRLSWPRRGAVIDGWIVQGNEVPQVVVECQCELILDLVAGIDLHNREFRLPEFSVQAGPVKVSNAVEFGPARLRESQAMALLQRFTEANARITPSFSVGRADRGL